MSIEESERKRLEAELVLAENWVTVYEDGVTDLEQDLENLEYRLYRANAHKAARVKERDRIKALLDS